MSSELSRLHLLLNSSEILPGDAYRRNKVIFELVSYVNCLIGCVLSQRRDALPVFIQRCRVFMGGNPPTSECKLYYTTVRSYVAEVERVFGPMTFDIE